MHDLTVISPIAPHHVHLFGRCRVSVGNQTTPVHHLFAVDTDGRGPGAIRNELLAQVDTPYVTFLDADDWLEPDFAAKTLNAFRSRSNIYIYTDWFKDEAEVVSAPECPWTGGTYHLVTAVIPTEWARAVGGFDETLRGMEDTDFYLKLTTRGFTSCRLPVPLVHYRRNGGRAHSIHESGAVNELQAELRRRYGGKQVSCCGTPAIVNDAPVGEKQPGDVLARALWGGNRTEMGRATGRHYPRMSYPKTAWVDPRDIAVSPHLWQEVPQALPAVPAPLVMPEPAPELKGVDALAATLTAQGYLRPALKERPQPIATKPTPNFNKVKRLVGAVDMPIFVAPRQEFPSYGDFWKLVELSGFDIRYANEIDLSDASKTYVFTGPVVIPDCTHAAARTIFWQLEYVGDYTQQENRHTVDEVWSSDPSHAAKHGYRYVLLGSHRHLNPDPTPAAEKQYQVAMLAYLTDRRREIKNRLSEQYSLAPDYPGHAGSIDRHEVLRASQVMVIVHQHDEAALAPLRFAIAAAYRLPVICEQVSDAGPYKKAALWTDRESIPSMVDLWFNGKLEADHLYDALYSLLCVKYPFDKCVMQALTSADGDKQLREVA